MASQNTCVVLHIRTTHFFQSEYDVCEGAELGHLNQVELSPEGRKWVVAYERRPGATSQGREMAAGGQRS